MMGNRKYFDQMLEDACHHHQFKITDEMDVTTVKEYMQVSQASIMIIGMLHMYVCTYLLAYVRTYVCGHV